MKALVFDTETTGLANHKEKVCSSSHPHLVQIGAALVEVDEDEGFISEPLSSISTLIKPDGWTVSEGAYKAHGISTERAKAFGIPVAHVLPLFFSLTRAADIIVCFNMSFDIRIIAGEYLRNDKPHAAEELEHKNQLCLMHGMTEECALPAPWGRGKFKWPSLEEAHFHCEGKDFANAHDAFADVLATLKVYRYWLQNVREKRSEPYRTSS